MGVRYLRVIRGSILGLNVRPVTLQELNWGDRRNKEKVADFRAEDWRGMPDGLHNQMLVVHVWTYGRWKASSSSLRLKPEGVMIIDVKPGTELYDEDDGEHLVIYGRPNGSFQEGLARLLAVLMYNFKWEDDHGFWCNQSYQYTVDIEAVFKRPVEVERHDGRTTVARAKERIEREVQKWMQSGEADELARVRREAQDVRLVGSPS